MAQELPSTALEHLKYQIQPNPKQTRLTKCQSFMQGDHNNPNRKGGKGAEL